MTTKQRREVIEITNEEAVYNKADVEELIGALENAIQYCEPQMVDILSPILKKALARWEGK